VLSAALEAAVKAVQEESSISSDDADADSGLNITANEVAKELLQQQHSSTASGDSMSVSPRPSATKRSATAADATTTATTPVELTAAQKTTVSDALAKDAAAMTAATSASVLSVVAMQARAIAQDEHMQVQQLVNDLVEVRLQQIEAKTKQLAELEALLEVHILTVISEARIAIHDALVLCACATTLCYIVSASAFDSSWYHTSRHYQTTCAGGADVFSK
jgi:SWIRM-associated region 1